MMVLLIYTLAIWAIGLLGALAPLAMASYNRMALALCNSAAAGVMLGAGFHLLHDASSSLEGLPGRWGNFPVAEFACGLAFIVVFYIETLFAPPVGPGEHHLLVDHIQIDRQAACFPPRGWEWQDEECGGSGSGCGGGGAERNPREGGPALSSSSSSASASAHPHEDHYPPHDTVYGAVSLSDSSSNGHKHGLLGHMQHTRVHLPSSPDKKQQQQHGHSHSHRHNHAPDEDRTPPKQKQQHQQRPGGGSSPVQSLLQQRHDDHDELHSLAGALCLLAALGFHAVIEGLGLATASYRDADHGSRSSTQLGVFLAILAHKGLAGITLGSSMLLASVNQTQFLLAALVFSAATPFGVGIGALISSYCNNGMALGLMAAVAAGTFIHVAAIEIIPSAFKDSSATQMAKLLSLTLGFVSMMALTLVTSS